MSKVFAKRITEKLTDDIREALAWLEWEAFVPRDARIFIKPNLTWKVHMPGVTTSPSFIVAVVEVLRERSDNVTIGESDGGYHSFEAEEAFHAHGLYDLRERLDVDVVNLSDLPREVASTHVLGRLVSVELPSMLLHEVDVFVTLPVPKVHAMTRVSLGFKNQWGCMPDIMRLRNHAQFPAKVVAINKLLNPRLAIFDGSHVLDRTGPTIGDPINQNILLVSDDVGAGSWAWCRIMNIDPTKVKHLVTAQKEGLFPRSGQEITCNVPVDEFHDHTFRLERKLVNWITLAAFNSRFLTRILYDSSLSTPLHNFLYFIRKNRFIGRLLYGEVGPPPVDGVRKPRTH